MRKLFLTAILAGATLLSPALTPPAQASPEWLAIGSVFRVGAAHISFVFGRPFYEYQPAYYYRYDEPIHYRGHQCSRHCFHDAGYDYHHESCPLVTNHFSHYRVDPSWAFSHYAPRYDRYGRSYRGDHYRRYDRYDRHDRHDRYDRYDRHRRYDRDGRYDRRDRDRRYDRDDRYDRHDRRRRDDRDGRYDQHDRDRRDDRDGRYDDRRDRREHRRRHNSGSRHD